MTKQLYMITFAPRRDVNGIRAIRRLLKYAGRYLGLYAVDVREEHDAAADDCHHPTLGEDHVRFR